MIESTVAHYGELNILVNNAGICNKTLPIADSDGNLFQQMLQTNVMACSTA